MTKTARLFFIIDRLRETRTISVGELASLCKISQRTVFRDVRDLQALQVPIIYDDGYQLAKAKKRPRTTIDIEEFEILCFALKTNPLASISGFDKKLKSLEAKLRNMSESPGKITGKSSGRRTVTTTCRRSVGARESRIFVILWKCAFEKRRVSLTVKSGSSGKTRLFSGRAERLVWKNDRWSINLRRSRSLGLSFLYLDEITSIQLGSDRVDFSRNSRR